MDLFFVIEIVVTLIETLFIFYLFTKQLGVAREKRPWAFVGWLCLFSATCIVNYIELDLSFTLVEGIQIYATRLIATGIEITWAILVFNGSLSKKFTWGLVPLFIATLSDFVTILVGSALQYTPLEVLMQPGQERILFLIIYCSTSVIIYFLLARMGRYNESRFLLPVYTRVYTIIILLLGAITIDQLIDISFAPGIADNTAIKNSLTFITISFFVIVTLVFFMVQRIGKLTQEKIDKDMQAALLAQHNQKMEEKNRLTEQNYYETRKIRHDNANHLRNIQGMLANKDYRALEEYLDGLIGEYPRTDLYITDNLPLNTLLTRKLHEAVQSEIKCNYYVGDIDAINKNLTDLCSILGNLLDNAIEACEKMPDARHRYIDFSMETKDNMLVIQIMNSSDGNYIKDGDEFLTSKTGLIHGVGLKSVQDAVKKHGGFLQITGEPHVFKVVVMLPTITMSSINQGELL